MMLIPNVYQLSGFVYGIHQNVYAIDSPEENSLTLIDCGLDQTDLSMIQANMKLWGLENRTISHVLLTHSHFDHAGNAHYFESLSAQICIGKDDAEDVETGNLHTLTFAYGMDFHPCKNVRCLADGEIIWLSDRFQIVAHHSPGHTKGSMCYELLGAAKTVLFTGDFLQSSEVSGEVRVGIKVDSSYSYQEYLKSAEKLCRRQFDCILAGHYQPVLNDNNLTGTLYRELLVNRGRYA